MPQLFVQPPQRRGVLAVRHSFS
ncbi:ORFL75C [Human betaherpesvirus 5]|nr:ORFL75C [Human betaherpesvirus 5]QHX40383.1 ORFL75C [Human betaherpesvirus 5]